MSMERNPMTLVEVKKNGSRVLTRLLKSFSLASLMAAGAMNVGCTSLLQPLAGIPVRRIPPQFLGQSKNSLVPLDPARLAQEPSRQYLLDKGDILGIYIEGVLPFTPTDKPPEPPPVNFPVLGSDQDPSVGYPIVVQESGTISLPNIEPIKVKGMTVEQVTELIRKAYLDANIFSDAARLRPIVTKLKERTYNIVVVRQDIGSSQQLQQNQQLLQGGIRGSYLRGSDQSASGSRIKLAAYKNDVLNALMESGGLPGLNARNEIKILRASKSDQKKRDEFVTRFYQQYYANPDPCGCPPPLPDDPNILKIPMRLPPGVIPSFRTEDIILEEGDVVSIESREAEVFYTGGLLPGGEFLLPRDYDLDVLGALGLAGQGVGSRQGGAGGGGFGIQQYTIPPSELFILRKTPCNGQIVILVDLTKATQDPRERPLVMPGDTLILRYKSCEEAANFGMFAFFTYGITQLFQGRR